MKNTSLPKHRFFVPPPQITNGTVCIRGADVWHISKVLRLKPGQHVLVFDGKGHEYLVRLGKQKRQEIPGTILDAWEQQTESSVKLSLVQGLPKSNKMDLIVQKASEIGVFEVIPLNSERSEWGTRTRHARNAQVHQRLERWSRIGIEASKQCGRTTVPFIRPVVTLEEYVETPPYADLKLVFWEEEQQAMLKHVLRECAGPVRHAVVIIGPEGGFTAEEIAMLQSHDYLPVSLGKRILRTETAGLVVLGILQYEFGDY